jgi:hypothetical protein
MRIALAFTACAFLLSLAGCTDAAAPLDGGVHDVGIHPPDLWDPGPEPGGNCGYGSGSGSGGEPGYGATYGGNCSPAVVSCATPSCVHGTCLSSDGGTDACICDLGYAGLLCDSCAPGYTAQGLTCVAADPCAAAPCVYGTCYPQAGGFYCECQTGYAGTLCDGCAPGYHVDNLQCVPG